MRLQDNSDKFDKELEDRVHRFLTDASLIVMSRARALCKRRTGELARSIFNVVEKECALVGSNLPQAPIMELGSMPHTILPNTKAALFWTGLNHPVKKVNHPGTRPVPFLRPALEASKKDIEEIAKREGIT